MSATTTTTTTTKKATATTAVKPVTRGKTRKRFPVIF